MTIDWDYTMVWFPASMLKVKNLKALIDMRNNDVLTVHLPRRRFVSMAEIRHGLTTLNSNNFFVYGQKHKVWVLFLVRTS